MVISIPDLLRRVLSVFSCCLRIEDFKLRHYRLSLQLFSPFSLWLFSLGREWYVGCNSRATCEASPVEVSVAKAAVFLRLAGRVVGGGCLLYTSRCV